MAIKLRDNTATNTGKGSELTYLEMDTNLESFYYSSSLAGGNLTLFTTGSVSHTIALGGATGAQGAPGNNGAQGAQGAASNVAGPQGAQGAEGAQGAPGNAAGPQGAQGAQGAGGTPGGSNTHVQFNQLGAFGGDAGLTYASASQILTIDKSTTPTSASPNIFLLGNSSTAGALSGVIAGSATIANTTPASIQFKNAVVHGLGDYGTDIVIKTAFSDGLGTTVERTAVNFTSSGDTHFGYDIFAPNLDNTVQDNVVGFNSTTGELTYFTTPGFFTRPGSATSVSFDTYENLLNKYSISSTAGVNPASNGQMSVDDTNPANVAVIDIFKTDNTGTSRATILGSMTVSGSLYMLQTGVGSVDAYYRILSITDNTTYYTFQVNYMTGTGTWAVDAVDQLELDSHYYHQLSTGYNRIDVTNNSGQTRNFILAAPTNPDPGATLHIELTRNAGGSAVTPQYMVRGYNDNIAYHKVKNIYLFENSPTASQMSLGASDKAIISLNTWNIGSGGQNQGLLLDGAELVIV